MNLQPQYISKLEKLLVADLSFNSLKAVPEGCALHTVAVLNLAFNKLASLPADIGVQMPNLQQLYLANNYLTSLPASLANTPVHDMFLSENNFDRVPQVRSACFLSACCIKERSPCYICQSIKKFAGKLVDQLCTATLASVQPPNVRPMHTWLTQCSCHKCTICLDFVCTVLLAVSCCKFSRPYTAVFLGHHQVVGRCNRLVKLSLAACELTHIGDELASLSNLRCVALVASLLVH